MIWTLDHFSFGILHREVAEAIKFVPITVRLMSPKKIAPTAHFRTFVDCSRRAITVPDDKVPEDTERRVGLVLRPTPSDSNSNFLAGIDG
jgi:hypothetical protein